MSLIHIASNTKYVYKKCRLGCSTEEEHKAKYAQMKERYASQRLVYRKLYNSKYYR